MMATDQRLVNVVYSARLIGKEFVLKVVSSAPTKQRTTKEMHYTRKQRKRCQHFSDCRSRLNKKKRQHSQRVIRKLSLNQCREKNAPDRDAKKAKSNEAESSSKVALPLASEEIQRAIESRDNDAFTKAVKSYCALLQEEEQEKMERRKLGSLEQNFKR